MLRMRHVHISLLIVLRMRKKKKTYFRSLCKKKSGIPIAQEPITHTAHYLTHAAHYRYLTHTSHYITHTARVLESEPEPPGAGVFGWSRSCHFGPAPAPP